MIEGDGKPQSYSSYRCLKHASTEISQHDQRCLGHKTMSPKASLCSGLESKIHACVSHVVIPNLRIMEPTLPPVEKFWPDNQLGLPEYQEAGLTTIHEK